MTDIWTERDEVPMFEVRVLRGGITVHTERCETTDEANLVAKHWDDIEGTTVEIVDLVASDPAAPVDDIELYETDEEWGAPE